LRQPIAANSGVRVKRSYWVVPGKLLAGCYPDGQIPESAQAKAKGLLAVGVTDIVNMMEATEYNQDGQGGRIICPI